MASVEMKTVGEAAPGVEPVDMKLEVVLIGVSDIDRAKAFYQKLGWRFDGDITAGDDFRIVQMTPHKSEASIIFGKGIRSAAPGLADSLVLAVDDLDAARAELRAASPRDVTVAQVAIRWGFARPATFAAHYRATFGESPSTTLHGD